ncbi:MAG: hypothetical protein V1809_12400 [Planctomycetota bacterium]
MKTWGFILMIAGIAIVAFSNKVVFPGLEILLGIETIVGKDNVFRLENGGYLFTNPGAMARWIAAVAGVGILVFGAGLTIFLMRGKGKSKQTGHTPPDNGPHAMDS